MVINEQYRPEMHLHRITLSRLEYISTVYLEVPQLIQVKLSVFRAIDGGRRTG